MTRSFAFLPTGHNLHLNDLANHEYFGDNFMDGKCSAAIFETPEGKFRCVWSYGSWDFNMEVGKHYDFEHTQSRAVTRGLKFVGVITKDNREIAKVTKNKVAQWTLK